MQLIYMISSFFERLPRTNFATHAATWRIWWKISTRFLLHMTVLSSDIACYQITLALVNAKRSDVYTPAVMELNRKPLENCFCFQPL